MICNTHFYLLPLLRVGNAGIFISMNTETAHNIYKNTAVIIVAGGSGTRIGTDLPKQFLYLDNKPILAHTLQKFRELFPTDHIITVVAESMTEYWLSECRKLGIDPGPLAMGGSSRWESVKNGIAAVNTPGIKYLLVHDAARPFVTTRVIKDIVEALANGHQGAIPVVNLTDSIRQITPTGSVPVDRSALRAVQTPQGFQADKLAAAFSLPYRPEFTDEATMMQVAGFNDIALTQGDEANIKITRPLDLQIAHLLINNNARPEDIRH